jgi:hypothetical protein
MHLKILEIIASRIRESEFIATILSPISIINFASTLHEFGFDNYRLRQLRSTFINQPNEKSEE